MLGRGYCPWSFLYWAISVCFGLRFCCFVLGRAKANPQPGYRLGVLGIKTLAMTYSRMA